MRYLNFDSRFRINILREIIYQKNKFPIQLAHMDDEMAYQFLISYYPYETYLTYAKMLYRKAFKNRGNKLCRISSK